MEPPNPIFIIEVLHGIDVGTRVQVAGIPRAIGRATSQDLVLRDLGVSRQHAVAVATPTGVLFEVRDGASALIIDGRPIRFGEAGVGDRIVIGNTMLLISAPAESPPSEPRSARGPMDARTLLGGLGADARALGAIYELIGSLDATSGQEALLQAVVCWGEAQLPKCTVELRCGGDFSHEFADREDGEQTMIVAPALADVRASLAFTCAAVGDRVPMSYRRMLVVAGRVFGSALARVRRAELADAEVAALRSLSFGSAREFVGTSPAALKLTRLIPRVAASDANAFLEGETGSGKSFVARLIHEQGPRAKASFRVINCAAIQESLIETELFGHERGAFTGAVARRIGAFEAAGSGTVFLDEIAELSLASQAKLLRVLDERRFQRVGSNEALNLEARVIVATNRDIESMTAQRLFRDDLFFRITTIRVNIPPLRDRREDIVLLAQRLLGDAVRATGRRTTGFTNDAIEAIRAYSWPGNVRELRNAINNAVALGDGPAVTAADLPFGIGGAPVQPSDDDLVRLPLSFEQLGQRGVAAAMRHTNNNRTRAAGLLGVSLPTLNKRLSTAREPGAGT